VSLNELGDYAGQHEVIAENLTSQIICELSRYLQELKGERKAVGHALKYINIYNHTFIQTSLPPHHRQLEENWRENPEAQRPSCVESMFTGDDLMLHPESHDHNGQLGFSGLVWLDLAWLDLVWLDLAWLD